MDWLKKNGIRVLMYHKVSLHKQDFMTVTVAQLEWQLGYLLQQKFQFISATQLLDYLTENKPLPPKPILLTFDDAYLNNLELAVPILQKYQAKALFFVPTAYIGQSSSWDFNAETILTATQLRSLPPELIELGLHSHTHSNYKHLTAQEMEQDLTLCLQTFKKLGLSFVPVFAYPYGGRPKDPTLLKAMKRLFQNSGVRLAFRIGNRINSFKIKDLYEINRLDIRGTDTIKAFKWKISWGKMF